MTTGQQERRRASLPAAQKKILLTQEWSYNSKIISPWRYDDPSQKQTRTWGNELSSGRSRWVWFRVRSKEKASVYSSSSRWGLKKVEMLIWEIRHRRRRRTLPLLWWTKNPLVFFSFALAVQWWRALILDLQNRVPELTSGTVAPLKQGTFLYLLALFTHLHM